MSVHQIIYTSCMRGINSVNDGQQVYSFDAAFTGANSDEIKSMFTYQPPSLEAGVVMSDEIALTMPKSFAYRRLENGSCAIALNTYLGRDYMGSSGRFGNHLSHVVVFDPDDTVNYPAEFYGGDLLRSKMKFEEVNNPDKPAYLPTPVLERGFAVDIDAVTDFLDADNRLEIYKMMLHAMLAFERERKRVVICDEPENIILWIAALGYALPLRNALHVNFSTYDFDPSLSSSQICGVVPGGTRFNSDSSRLHFVFDMMTGNTPKFEVDTEFSDFIDTAMSFSYESLQDFHAFICRGYHYDKADEKVYAAYILYSLLSDGIGAVRLDRLEQALRFAEEYAVPDETQRLIGQLLSEEEALLHGEKSIFLRVIEYILGHISELDGDASLRLKALVVDRILCEFLNDNVVEDEFAAFYEKVNAASVQRGFSVATELMKPDSRGKLFAVMKRNIAAWKITFLVTVISDYVKDQGLPVSQLLIDAPLGQTYYGIVKAVYTQSRQNGFFVVAKILDAFSSDCTYLVNMGLNLEGMLLDLPAGSQEADAMWKYFGQVMLSAQAACFDVAYAILGSYQRYGQVYMLYTLALSKASGPEQCKEIYEKHYRALAAKEPAYASQYYDKVLDAYYRCLGKFDASAAYGLKSDLFDLLASQKIDVPFADELVRDLTNPMPLGHPGKADTRLILDIFKYTYNFCGQPIKGKALLLLIGISLEGIKGKQHLYDKMEQLERLAYGNKADLTRETERSVQAYFDWLLPNVCGICDRTADIEAVYDLFEMPAAVEAVFFAQCAKIYLKQSKGGKEYSLFCEFLGAVFHKATVQSHNEVGKALCKLNKQRFEDLDDAVRDYFRNDSRALRSWDDIRNTAESTNPIFNNISNLFRRRKD